MLGYQQRIRDRHIAHHGGTTVPVVIPIVIYQGHRPGTHQQKSPRSPPPMTDSLHRWATTCLGPATTSTTSPASTTTRYAPDNSPPDLRVVYVSLRRGPGDTDFTVWLPDWRPRDHRSFRPDSVHARQLPCIRRQHHWEKLRAFAATTGPHTEEIIATAAGRLITEAWAEGEARGEARLLVKQLTTRYGALNADLRERLENATTDDIELWATRFAQGAATLDGSSPDRLTGSRYAHARYARGRTRPTLASTSRPLRRATTRRVRRSPPTATGPCPRQSTTRASTAATTREDSSPTSSSSRSHRRGARVRRASGTAATLRPPALPAPVPGPAVPTTTRRAPRYRRPACPPCATTPVQHPTKHVFHQRQDLGAYPHPRESRIGVVRVVDG